MKHLLLIILMFAAAGSSAQKVSLYTIVFHPDDHTLTERLSSQLDTMYDKLQRGATLNLGIAGGIGTHLSTRQANRISERRAKTVSDYLIARGLDPADVAIRKTPSLQNRLTADKSSKKHDKRMRYEVIVHKPRNEYRRLVRPDTTIIPETQPQYFAVYLRSGNVIVGREGTRISFTDNCFEHMNGTRVECEVLILELKEFFTNSSMLAQSLATRSGQRPLETGGMLSIKVYCNGKELKVKENKTFEVKMPAYLKNQGMEVFQGNSDGSDWKRTGQEFRNVPRSSVQGMEGSEGPDFYQMQFNKLGWINCDKFMAIENPVKLTVKFPDTLQPSVVLIFHKMNSILPAAADSGKASFEKVPANEPATLLVYAIKNKRMYLYTKDLNVSEEEQQADMKLVSRDHFRMRLREFDDQ
jgi:hypothetical protein